jgi:hypothetical protein
MFDWFFSIKGGARVVIRHQTVFVYPIANMCSIKLIVLIAVFACTFAEPPRRRFNSGRTFARQEAAEQPESEGYNYEPPAESSRLRLPIKFRQFARNEEESSGGYSYPKPTDSYGPPAEETTEPSPEYGTPEGTTEEPEEAATTDDNSTDNPQAERFSSAQFRRKNSKITQKSQKLRNQAVRRPAQLKQQPQPIVYVQYPTASLTQPQYVYVF